MTAAERKQAERTRRKLAGEVRVECWLPSYLAHEIDVFRGREGFSQNKAMVILLSERFGLD